MAGGTLTGNLNLSSSYIDFSGSLGSAPTTAAAIYRPADNSLAISTGNAQRLLINNSGATVTGTCTATTFSGSGSSLTSLNASNISSGTISSSRIPTLNQDTTGNAATVSVTPTNASGTYYPLFSSGTGASTIYNDGGGSVSYNPSTNVLTAGQFSGNGSLVTNLNASNISSGTISSSRIPTLNQNTTGSSGSCTGTAANAALLDNIDSSQFVRSDASDTLTGNYLSLIHI